MNIFKKRITIFILAIPTIIFLMVFFIYGFSNNNSNNNSNNISNNIADEIILEEVNNISEIKVLIYNCDGAVWLDKIAKSIKMCNYDNLLPGFKITVTVKYFDADNKLSINELINYDVLLVPGGYPSIMYKFWIPDDIRAWVYNGGGYLGICAGEILAIEGDIDTR